MLTSARNYSKKQKNPKKWTVRMLGQMAKAKLYRQNHIKQHILSQKEKK